MRTSCFLFHLVSVLSNFDMTRYDSQGVPILGFHNPAGTILYPNGLYSYSIGNTRARDITEMLGTSKKQHLDLLLLASGDVRNVFYTVSEISLRKAKECPKSLSFHLNDYDPSVVARNAILLEVASSINTDVSDDVDFLWNAWYNMTLSEAHFARLQRILSEMIDKGFDSDELTALKFQDSAVLKECRDIWKDWKKLDLNVNSVKEERSKFIENDRQRIGFTIENQCLGVVTKMEIGITAHQDGDEDVSSPERMFSMQFNPEIKHWFIEGSTSDDSNKVNPTLIRPFVHKWKQHYGACAFHGYLPFDKQDLLRCKTLTDACKESLKFQVKCYQNYKKSHSLKVSLWTGDALSLCANGFPPDLAFDVIDTSNVGDHIGLLNVLVCCAPRLKEPNTSLLYTSSILWEKSCQSVEDFYNKSIGVPVQLLPTILGLKLAVNLDLGSSKLPGSFESNEEILLWVKAEPKRTLLTIDENGDVAQAFLHLAERCFNLFNVPDSKDGITLSSPLTFLRIVRQIQPLVRGGATALLNLLESKLPSDFNKKFGLSWNLVKASAGSEREPIVEIKVSTPISVVVPRFKGTLNLMACIANHKPFEEGEFPTNALDFLFGPHLPSEDTDYSLIYNSVRYDDTAQMVTFHLREKDWNDLKSNSCMWIASNDHVPIPIIKQEKVFLGSESVKAVEQVDPEEKFGLFAVQTFEVESSSDCEILKVLKVQENTSSYSAELEILDAIKCKGKQMKTRFLPDICPNKVAIYFQGAEREECIIHFSCVVEENSSKFRISRKQETIQCHIPKREEGTVGELVIQRPASIPFHVMPLWDLKRRHLLIQLCGTMFRTKQDFELKSRRSSGPPFFDLRESISRILHGHIQDPKHPTVYCLDERGIIEDPYQTPNDFARKRGFMIKVLGLYKWKNVPVAKVLFYDCEKYASEILDAKTFPRVWGSWALTYPTKVERIVADRQEKSLLRKLLYTNAARVTQDNDFYAWKDSFLCLLFPRERSPLSEKEDNERDNFLLSLNARSTTPESLQDNPFELPTNSLHSGKMGPWFTGNDRASDCNPPQGTASVKVPKCAFCQIHKSDLKRCLGCEKVSYCGRICQRQHWKVHKPECRKAGIKDTRFDNRP